MVGEADTKTKGECTETDRWILKCDRDRPGVCWLVA